MQFSRSLSNYGMGIILCVPLVGVGTASGPVYPFPPQLGQVLDLLFFMGWVPGTRVGCQVKFDL